MTVRRLAPYATTIFSEVSQLAVRFEAVNLGQGFPDTDGPASMIEAAARAMREGHNQYPPGTGVPELRRAIVAHETEHTGLVHDPDTEVLVTVGATEAIAGAVVGLVEPDDEVVVIEPYYDSYAATVAMAGATRRAARMVRSGDTFRLDVDSLRAAFSPRTRAVLVNTPHNPTGAVLPREDLEEMAALCHEFDAIAISDEVYEHLTFDGHEHVSIATLPGMADRTLRISSAGKMLNCTGWKVGWVTGPSDLVAGVRTAKQYMSFTGGTPLQLGVAHALRHEGEWIRALSAQMQDRRDHLVEILTGVGLDLAVTQGTYFLTADPRPLGVTDAASWCLELPEKIGVAAVPFAPFTDTYSDEWSHLVRFAFCKRPEVLAEAGRRLGGLAD
ncbi:pyridoxal phosphate-dependent aminotransferase [Dietzia sp. PP-33]|jgi:N-succinyldiaminopimelate aminotransferase|uniref:pyridoxal phosphate-dependent aminotransferase n=1 Tax=Dietzia sp. PP-33 TaxID=2957500 RepID=UPI0029A72C46|nr:pyridoxal phosphate-dependent aminotransferase [Dietzia sp. PP-33]MDX2356410.1 pyridoxal phosphate-dependent aminotransferase [Dietzia sp. PP-33]